MNEATLAALALVIFGWAIVSEWFAARNVAGPLVFIVTGFLVANSSWGDDERRHREFNSAGAGRNTEVTVTLVPMRERTGAESYLKARLSDPEYRAEYKRVRQRIDQIDRVIRALDDRREELKLSKAELARRAEMPPEAVRRLFSAERPNPTLHTLAAIAEALGLDLTPGEERPQRRAPRATRARSGASGTRPRTA